MKLLRNLLFLGLFFCSITLGFLAYIWTWSQKPLDYTEVIVVEIPKNSSLKQILMLLKEKGIISQTWILEAYLRIFGTSIKNRLQDGEYAFNPRLAPIEILNQMRLGLVKEYIITIPEGYAIQDILKQIELAGLKVKHIPMQLEGYLFPDTYVFTKRMTAEAMLEKMKARLKEVLSDPIIQERMQALNLDTHTLLTLASVVEKETGAKEERPLIAGVFYNRLKIGMPLQSDPTVSYNVPTYTGKITKAMLLDKNNPYNTYTHRGLPPGPIASPGLLAIQAVLWPKESNYLYFVSRNDGTHEFCPDYKCHLKAVKKWQLTGK